jgi:TetR/AcrR family transcriptional regulator
VSRTAPGKARLRKRADSSSKSRRAIGRPPAGEQGVGREALIDKTCELLRELPPNRVTRAEVARHTNVDPSLIRYYFHDRSSLLIAAAERLSSQFGSMLEEETKRAGDGAEGMLRARVAAVLKFEITYPFFHRLLLEEVMTSKAPAAKKLLSQLTERGLTAYHSILNGGVKSGLMRKVDPAFLFLAVIGMCEFFVSGMPMLKLAHGGKVDPRAAGERYGDFVSDLVLNGLSANGAAGRKARARR